MSEETFAYGHDISTSGDVTVLNIPEQIRNLAERLAKIHGPVRVSHESGGYHIALADPELLEQDGAKEFTSKHLSINADKYFLTGKWDYSTNKTLENKKLWAKKKKGWPIPCASSMKTGKRYDVNALLYDYQPVEKRLPQFAHIKHEVSTGNSGKNLETDRFGNQVPAWVGETVPLTELPDDHPAIEYVKGRGFDPARLVEQFEACYCTEAAPEDRAKGVYYSKLPGGLRNTPKGRIVFTVRMNGVRWGYQSRYIDKWDGNVLKFWSGDEWVPVKEVFDDGSEIQFFEKSEYFPQGFSPHKYINAIGGSRNKWLMGFDAAVKFNEDRNPKDRFCVLVEGPLDAGKLGPPAIALMGKAFSVMQAEYVAKAFGSGRVCVIPDNDKAGQQGLAKVKELMGNHGIRVTVVNTGGTVKDVGELSYDEASELLYRCDPTKLK